MVDNIVRRPIGLVLLATAHMVLNGPSQAPAEFNRTLGSSFTFHFRFNDTVIDENSHFAVYITGQKKIAEHPKHKGNLGVFQIYQNTSVLYRIENLKQNDSEMYWASVFVDSGPPRESNKVQLSVQDGNRTVSPRPNNTIIPENPGSSRPFSSYLVLVLVAPVVLLAAALPLLIWCLVRTKEKQQQPRQNSNPTVQEAVAGSNTGPPPSLIYSVLDFAKRPAAVGTKPNDTEYAAVSYPPDNRRM